ncbi:MAG: DUF2911 domain-containing protein [Cytophagales bacterium]|nr:DUF2911 domain-containing protein [Cytophagales bacterium]
MLKKILIGIGILILAFILYSVYVLFIADPVSPLTSGSYSDQGLEIEVSYSQPSKKGRLIFGSAEDGALQPYGEYWRLGANAATEVTFSKAITFAGEPLDAGTYRMYAVPGAGEFKVGLNSELDIFFGIGEPDYDLDVLTVMIPVQKVAEVETLAFQFSSDSITINMDFVWATSLIRIPITIQ